MKILFICSLLFVLSSFLLAQSREEKLLKLKNREDIKVTEVEKDLLKHLRKSVGEHESFTKARDFVVNTINEHGGVMAEHRLLDLVRAVTEEEANSLRFLLNLIQEIKQLEADFAKTSWVTPALNK